MSAGVVIPVVLHFGATAGAVQRWQRGFDGLMLTSAQYFARELGQTIRYVPTTSINLTAQGRTRAQVEANPWGEALGAATQAGYPLWQENYLVTMLIAETSYALAGFGGASPTPATGATVKDGDLLEIVSQYHEGGSVAWSEYSVQAAVQIHELLHGMHANDHDDYPGDNIEHEWWAGLDGIITPSNKAKLLASVWVSPENNPDGYTLSVAGVGDITNRVLADSGIALSRGADAGRLLAPRVGALEATLDNSDLAYAPDAPFIIGRDVTFHGPAYAPISRGVLASTQRGGREHLETLAIAADGALARLTRVEMASTQLYQNIRVDQAIHHILDVANVPSALRDIDVTLSSMRWWWMDDESPLDALIKVWHTEGPPSIIYEDRQGRICFRTYTWRFYRPRSMRVQGTYGG